MHLKTAVFAMVMIFCADTLAGRQPDPDMQDGKPDRQLAYDYCREKYWVPLASGLMNGHKHQAACQDGVEIGIRAMNEDKPYNEAQRECLNKHGKAFADKSGKPADASPAYGACMAGLNRYTPNDRKRTYHNGDAPVARPASYQPAKPANNRK